MLGVTNGTCNNLELLKIASREVLAVGSYHHDHPEDRPEALAKDLGVAPPHAKEPRVVIRSPFAPQDCITTTPHTIDLCQAIIHELGLKSEEEKSQAVFILVACTDDPAFNSAPGDTPKQKRSKRKQRISVHQLERAQQDSTGIVAAIRALDKIESRKADILFAKEAGVPAEMKTKAYLEGTVMREELVQKLNVPQIYKDEMALIRAEIEFMAFPIRNRLLFGSPRNLCRVRALSRKTALASTSLAKSAFKSLVVTPIITIKPATQKLLNRTVRVSRRFSHALTSFLI